MKNLLLTGAHRSGSTWAGKVICSGGTVHYINEPFNLGSNRKWNPPLSFWFEYIGENSSEEKKATFKNYIERVLKYDNYMSPVVNLARSRNSQAVKEVIKGLRFPARGRRLIKDPVAIFATEWLAETFDLDVVVTLRHPIAFAASLKKADWRFDFNDMLNQKDLMNSLLKPYEEKIKVFLPKQEEVGIIEHAVLLWDIIYYTVYNYQQRHSDWVVIRHEDLSLQPEAQFKKVFEHFEVEYNQRAKDYILSTTQASKDTMLARDSKSNLNKWKKILTNEEVEFVTEKLYDHPSNYYRDEEWEKIFH